MKKPKKRTPNSKRPKIKILYANADGITGKTNSLIAAAQAADAEIIGLAETKLGTMTPAIPGYSWAPEAGKHKAEV